MYLNGKLFIDYGDVPASIFGRLVDLVSSLTEEDWQKNRYRQESFEVHSKTQAFIYRFVDDDNTRLMFDDLIGDGNAPGVDVLRDVFSFAEQALGLGQMHVDRCMFARLPAGKNIPQHIDAAKLYDVSHRLHVPVITNPKCHFRVGSQFAPMKAGRLIEINNRALHSVVNAGDADRIHLIFDMSKK